MRAVHISRQSPSLVQAIESGHFAGYGAPDRFDEIEHPTSDGHATGLARGIVAGTHRGALDACYAMRWR